MVVGQVKRNLMAWHHTHDQHQYICIHNGEGHTALKPHGSLKAFWIACCRKHCIVMHILSPVCWELLDMWRGKYKQSIFYWWAHSTDYWYGSSLYPQCRRIHCKLGMKYCKRVVANHMFHIFCLVPPPSINGLWITHNGHNWIGLLLLTHVCMIVTNIVPDA